MLTGRADRKRARKKLLCALLAALLLTCIGACAETAEGPDLDLINPDLILAQDTVDYLELTGSRSGAIRRFRDAAKRIRKETNRTIPECWGLPHCPTIRRSAVLPFSALLPGRSLFTGDPRTERQW